MKKITNAILIAMMVITVVLLAWAVFFSEGHSAANLNDPAISANLVWAYILGGLGILSAVACAVKGTLSNPKGLKGTLISIVLVVAVIVIAYVVAAGHDVQVYNVGAHTYFDRSETVISDASLIVVYIVAGCAIVSAIVSEVLHALK